MHFLPPRELDHRPTRHLGHGVAQLWRQYHSPDECSAEAPDQRATLPTGLPAGALRLAYLGYWSLEALQSMALQTAGRPLAEGVPLLATLLSLPMPKRYPSLTLSPLLQKQKTQEIVVAWLLAEAAQQSVLTVWEGVHWANPSALELLGLLLDHVPTDRMLLVLTGRPEFRPPWTRRSYVTLLTLTRLSRAQSAEMVLRGTGDKTVPAEVQAQLLAKTEQPCRWRKGTRHPR